MDNIVIIHFGPVELYPPLQNFIRFLENADPKQKITILTTTGMYKQLQEFKPHHPAISIQRIGRSGPGPGRLSRLVSYLSFYLGATWQLLMKRPATVLYYETISSFPVYLYKRIIAPQANIMIHYHEYTSPVEYEQGMWLTKYFHKLERSLYPQTIWVSHTNVHRMDLFLDNIKPINIPKAEVVPNFPTRSWHQENIAPHGLPLRLVYVGALSMDTMYTKEMAEWVLSQNGDVTWHIYSYNITAEAEDYLRNLKSSWVKLFDGKDYSVLPSILCNYHVGVILYNGHIPNYVYNAPNKLFEYLNAGLQVWLPQEMIGARKYVDGLNVYAITFAELKWIDIPAITDFKKKRTLDKAYYAEDAFETMRGHLLGYIKNKFSAISF